MKKLKSGEITSKPTGKELTKGFQKQMDQNIKDEMSGKIVFEPVSEPEKKMSPYGGSGIGSNERIEKEDSKKGFKKGGFIKTRKRK